MHPPDDPHLGEHNREEVPTQAYWAHHPGLKLHPEKD